MGILLALTLLAWAAGGVVSGAWIFWLDRRRGELGAPIKAATVFAWPILLPLLLYQREDLTAWQAARNASVCLLLLSPGPVLEATARLFPSADAGEFKRDPGPVPRCDASCSSSVRRLANSGLAHYEAGRFKQAARDFKECLVIESGYEPCRNGLKFAEARLIIPAVVLDAPVDPSPAAPSDNDRREAVRYWNSGIIFYQKGDFENALKEWNACLSLDPANGECKTGMQRIEQSYGPGP